MKARYALTLAALAVIFGLVQLSFNARTAARLRDQIVAQDQAGTTVTTELDQLEQFSHSHINSSVRFELTGSYQRALAATQPPSPSGTLYSQAQAACAGKADSVTQAHCVTDYVSKRLPPPSQPTPPPNKAAFMREFHSPVWTSDLAGLSFLAAAVLLVSAGLLRILRPSPSYL